jgi:DNA-binding Lrp family transcriptional regulator
MNNAFIGTSQMRDSNVNDVTFDAADLRILAHLQCDAGVSNQDLAKSVHVSAATCLRRVRRLEALGVIERRVALLAPESLDAVLQVVCEVSLDHQSAEELEIFEAAAVAHPAVQQCYRVSPGPDFVLLAVASNMASWAAVVADLFTRHRNVRNVKSFFVVKRSKFDTRWPLPQTEIQLK